MKRVTKTIKDDSENIVKIITEKTSKGLYNVEYFDILHGDKILMLSKKDIIREIFELIERSMDEVDKL